MKSAWRPMIVFIALGAFVNVAMAWACAWWMPFDQKQRPWMTDVEIQASVVSDYIPETWRPGLFDQNDPLVHDGERCRTVGFTVEYFSANMERWSQALAGWGRFGLPQINIESRSAGWPFRSLECHVISNIVSVAEAARITRVGALHGADWMPSEHALWRVLPCIPGWPAFVANTIVYALVLWLIWLNPLTLRRRWRIKHRLCPACAYPIGSNPVCTECGEPIASGVLISKGDCDSIENKPK